MGQYFETKGKSGEPPDMASAVELARLNEEWLGAASTKDREQVWQRMLQIHRDMLFSIGIVSGVLQPVVAKRNLMNVPEKAVYNWDPGAHSVYISPTRSGSPNDDGRFGSSGVWLR